MNGGKLYQRLTDLSIKSDERLSKRYGYACSNTATALHTLFLKGSVEVGYRQSCGRTDPTTYIYREWVKIIKAVEKAGILVRVDPVKHGNAYATMKGGFWSSAIYSISNVELEAAA